MEDGADAEDSPRIVILQNIKLTPLTHGPFNKSGNYPQLHAVSVEKKTSIKHGTLTIPISAQDNKEQLTAATSSEAKVSDRSLQNKLPEVIDQPEAPLYIKSVEQFNLFTEHTGPEWHKGTNNIVTKPIIAGNLPKAVSDSPIYGCPNNNKLPEVIDQPEAPPYTQTSKLFKKYKKVKVFTEHTGPERRSVTNNIVTKPIIAGNLAKAVSDSPIYGCPNNNKLPEVIDQPEAPLYIQTSKQFNVFTEHTGPEWHKRTNNIVTKPIAGNLPKSVSDFPIFGCPNNNKLPEVIDQPEAPPYTQTSKQFKKYKKVKVFTEHTGPEWHKVTNNIVTKPIIAGNLSKAFSDFPIHGRPKKNEQLKSFQDKACQKFVGLPYDKFAKVEEYCSPDLLLSGREMQMASQRPTQGHLSAAVALKNAEHGIVSIPENPKLHTLRKLQTRLKCDVNHIFARRLKYRGVRLLSLQNQKASESDKQPPNLEPGKDILFRVRVYRPFSFSLPGGKSNPNVRGRHSVFNCDVLVLGRQSLTELRDRIVCRNDLDLRLDMSEHPNLPPPTTSKESFPSNFMFINNVFYVDTRPHCRDISAVIRKFAEARGLGAFPVRDMGRVTVGELNLRLAYPEVYVHQGNCEHIFQFSEIRLLTNADPLHISNYPRHSSVSQNQMLYCNTCAEFAARWVVTKSKRVPFDPAFFCETCFHSYMYIDGKKVEDFKAYLYKGNELNMLRPNIDLENLSDSEPSDVQDKVLIHY